MSSNLNMYDAIRNAYQQMHTQFQKSWMYWPLRIFSSLGGFLEDNPDLFHKKVKIFIQNYIQSAWFFQWWFKSYLDEQNLKSFEKVIDTYGRYVKEDSSNFDDFLDLPIDFLENLDQNILPETLQSCQRKDLEMLQLLKLKTCDLEKLLKKRGLYDSYKDIINILNEKNIDFPYASLLEKEDSKINDFPYKFELIQNFLSQFNGIIDVLFDWDYFDLKNLIDELQQQDSYNSCTSEDLKMYQKLSLYSFQWATLLEHRKQYENINHIIEFYKKNNITDFSTILPMGMDIEKKAYVIKKLNDAQCLSLVDIHVNIKDAIYHNINFDQLYHIVYNLAENKSLSPATFRFTTDGFPTNCIDGTNFYRKQIDCILTLKKVYTLENVNKIIENLSDWNFNMLTRLLTDDSSIKFDLNYLHEVQNINVFLNCLTYIKNIEVENISTEEKNKFLKQNLSKISQYCNENANSNQVSIILDDGLIKKIHKLLHEFKKSSNSQPQESSISNPTGTPYSLFSSSKSAVTDSHQQAGLGIESLTQR